MHAHKMRNSNKLAFVMTEFKSFIACPKMWRKERQSGPYKSKFGALQFWLSFHTTFKALPALLLVFLTLLFSNYSSALYFLHQHFKFALLRSYCFSSPFWDSIAILFQFPSPLTAQLTRFYTLGNALIPALLFILLWKKYHGSTPNGKNIIPRVTLQNETKWMQAHLISYSCLVGG